MSVVEWFNMPFQGGRQAPSDFTQNRPTDVGPRPAYLTRTRDRTGTGAFLPSAPWPWRAALDSLPPSSLSNSAGPFKHGSLFQQELVAHIAAIFFPLISEGGLFSEF